MAEILPFPAARRADAHPRARAPEAGASDDRSGEDARPGDDDPEDGGVGLALVAGLAAVPAPSLDALALRVEVLAARLAPPDGDAGAGLCAAEARLLRAVLRDLRALAADLAFAAAQGAPGPRAPAPAG